MRLLKDMAKKFRKGDNVIIITGKYKGKISKILKVDNQHNKVILEKVNYYNKKKQIDSRKQIIEKKIHIHISNISHIFNKKPSRVGFKKINNQKVRFIKKDPKTLIK